MSKERKIYRLSDDFIDELSRVVSLALATGSNITHHLRQFRVEAPDGEALETTPEYRAYIENLVTKMTEEVNAKLEAMEKAGAFSEEASN